MDLPLSKEAQLRELIENSSAYITSLFERYCVPLLVAYSVVYYGVTVLLARTRIFWHDEISTEMFSSLRGQALNSALISGADSHPPLFFMLTRWCRELLGPSELSARLPAIAGFWLMTICVFAFVRKRSNAVYGLTSVFLILTTASYAYAYEARPYGLLMGFSALALLAWQHTDCALPFRWIPLTALAASLSLAISSHYFAVLVWIPLVLAELLRSIKRGRLDWLVWAALFTGLAPLPFYWPLLSGLRSAVGHNFWARPGLGMIGDTYRSYMTLSFAPLLAAICVSLALIRRDRAARVPDLPFPEFAAGLLLAGLPIFSVALAFITGGYTHRYALPSVAGIAITLTLFAYRRSCASPVVGVVSLVVFASWFLLKIPSAYRTYALERGAPAGITARPFASRAWRNVCRENDLPIVAANSVFYMQLQRYAPAEIAPRVYYVTDTEAALRHVGQTTGDLLMAIDARLFGLRVQPWRQFASEHPRFLLLVSLAQPDWQTPEFLRGGARLALRSQDSGEVLYDVSLKR